MDTIDLRSDLMAPRSLKTAQAMYAAASGTPAMDNGEDFYERTLMDLMARELGVEATLLVPTCTMANQIAIRLHLPEGGLLASAGLAHVVTVEAPATALTGVRKHVLPSDRGHPPPSTVAEFLAEQKAGEPTLVWLENTHMLSAGSVMPDGWQREIGVLSRGHGAGVHLDGSRLWNAAVVRNAAMSTLMEGCDTAAISLNKAVGAPVGSVLAGSRAAIDEAARWRDAMGGQWRPVGVIAAAALAALDDWRERLEADRANTRTLAEAIVGRLGEHAVQPADTNLIFLNRANNDGSSFVEALGRRGVKTTMLISSVVRLAVHGGVGAKQIKVILEAVTAADGELAAAHPESS